MKKKLIALTIAVLSTLATQAQTYRNGQLEKKETTDLTQPKQFFTISSGIGSPFGNVGIGFAQVVNPNIIAELGLGLNIWGLFKIGLEGNYYLDPSKKGLAFGAGLSTTVVEAPVEFTMGNSNYQYDYQMKRAFTGNINALYNFTIKNKHHFYIRLGYAIPINKPYEFTNPTVASLGPDYQNVVNSIKLLAPRGIIFGTGFRFKVR